MKNDIIKRFFRVCDVFTHQGLWYDQEGRFTGLIHDIFNFCMNSELQMPFNRDVVGYLSATGTLEDLFSWFSKEDILKLQDHRYGVYEYWSDDYKFHMGH